MGYQIYEFTLIATQPPYKTYQIFPNPKIIFDTKNRNLTKFSISYIFSLWGKRKYAKIVNITNCDNTRELRKIGKYSTF